MPEHNNQILDLSLPRENTSQKTIEPKAFGLGNKVPNFILKNSEIEEGNINRKTFKNIRGKIPKFRLEYSNIFGEHGSSGDVQVGEKLLVNSNYNDKNAISNREYAETLATIQEKQKELDEILAHLGEDTEPETIQINLFGGFSFDMPLPDHWTETKELRQEIGQLEGGNRNKTIITHEQLTVDTAIRDYTTRSEYNENNKGGEHPLPEYDFQKESPVQMMIEEYADAPEEDKINLVRTLGYTMLQYYSTWLARNAFFETFSPEEVWQYIRDEDEAGICGNIHAEMARLAEGLGIKADLITVGAKGGLHTLMKGVKEDGTHFFVDYAGYYESENLNTLIDVYNTKNKSFSTLSYQADKDGNMTGIRVTDLQRRTRKIIYMDFDAGDNDNQDGIQVKINGNKEARITYGKRLGNVLASTFIERMHALGTTQDYWGVSLLGKRAQKEWGVSVVHGEYQNDTAYSGFYKKEGEVLGTQVFGGFSAGLSVTDSGKIIDAQSHIHTGLEKNGYFVEIDGLLVPRDLVGDFDHFTLSPTLSLGGKNPKGEFALDLGEYSTQVSGTIYTTSGKIAIILSESNGENIETRISGSRFFNGGELFGEISEKDGEVGGKFGIKVIF